MPDFKRTVYILGAGFSKPANAPLMKDYFDAVQNCYHNPPQTLTLRDKAAFEFVIRFRQDMARLSDVFEVHLDNLEQLFGLLEMQVAAGIRSPLDRQNFILAILRTLEMTVRTPNHDQLPDTYSAFIPISHTQSRFKELGLGHTTWLYDAFATMIAKSHFEMNGLRDTVISFNYDLLLDRALCDIGFKVNYGLPNTSTVTGYHEITASFTDTAVPYYKVHGSANWIRCECPESHDKGVYIAPPRVNPKAAIDTLLQKSLENCPWCTRALKEMCKDPLSHHTPIIIPPTWNKAGYQSFVQPVWVAAMKALREAWRIVIIGFSLPETDIFFRYMLMAGLEIGRGVDVYLFDPDPAVAERYKTFLSRQFQTYRFFPNSTKFDGSNFPGFADQPWKRR